jgi:hypothetical protein
MDNVFRKKKKLSSDTFIWWWDIYDGIDRKLKEDEIKEEIEKKPKKKTIPKNDHKRDIEE